MNKDVGDRGASANDLVTDHSPDRGFCESLKNGGLTPYQSGKEVNHKERNDRAKLANKHHSFMAPRVRFFCPDRFSEVELRSFKSLKALKS